MGFNKPTKFKGSIISVGNSFFLVKARGIDMSTYSVKCDKCGKDLIIDDGDCYAGGDKEMEFVFCPNCENELSPVYTSGIPHVYFDTKK